MAYFIINIKIPDPDKRNYYDEYTEKVKPIVEKFSGRYIIRSERITALSDSWKPDRIIVIQFTDKEKIYAWLSSPEYKAIAGLRENSVESEAVIVEEDQMPDGWRVGENHNPWRDFPHDIYVKHMGHESVGQLETLSRITGEQLALVADILSPVIAVLGITDGNGLCNVEPGRCKAIIGIDINQEYLDICNERYGNLPELELVQIDLMTEKDRAVELLQTADLVTANLLVKHIHLDNFIDIVGRLTKPLVSVTIQFNLDGEAVSHSGYEVEFEGIQRHGQECGEAALTEAMRVTGYDVLGRTEYTLPNKKVFIRLDYRR